MQCKNHPGVESVARCTGCQESFCSNCLVEIAGKHYCGSCKIMAIEGRPAPVVERIQTEECKDAKEALIYALVGIVCLGIILEPIAIIKALSAKKELSVDPNLSGAGKANAALIIASITLILWIITIIAKVVSYAH